MYLKVDMVPGRTVDGSRSNGPYNCQCKLDFLGIAIASGEPEGHFVYTTLHKTLSINTANVDLQIVQGNITKEIFLYGLL